MFYYVAHFCNILNNFENDPLMVQEPAAPVFQTQGIQAQEFQAAPVAPNARKAPG